MRPKSQDTSVFTAKESSPRLPPQKRSPAMEAESLQGLCHTWPLAPGMSRSLQGWSDFVHTQISGY